VVLLDRDAAPEVRAIGEAMIASCASCARLHADLLALSLEHATLPVPSRPRSFELSPAVAASLRIDEGREPALAGARLSGEMTDSPTTHAAHDRVLIASLLDRSINADDRARAETQIAACDACRWLHSDLIALSQATRDLPAPVRPREFTLTPEDAERLRVRGWRRVLGFFGSAGDVFSRPLAIGLTTLGIAGLLVGTVPLGFGGAASGPQALSTVGTALDQRDSFGGAGPAGAAPEMATQASAAPSAAPASGAPAAAAAPTTAPDVPPAPAASAGGAETTPPDVLFEGGEQSNLTGEKDASSKHYGDLGGGQAVSPLILTGGLLLLVGVSLFALRWTGRHLRE
jgi:anti-sigma factor RsiW